MSFGNKLEMENETQNKNKAQTEKTSEPPKSKMLLGAAFIDPEELVNMLSLREGMAVADFGCGTGYFVAPLSEKVGNKGIVYAIDILNEKLEAVKSLSRLAGLGNVVTMRANLEKTEGSRVEKDSVDWVILVNMLFQNKNKLAILREAKRILKKGGRAFVIEWNDKDFTLGPDKKNRVKKDELVRLSHEQGMGVEKELNIGPYHYALVLAKYK